MKHFILDVDGVMTTGHFLYTVDGKAMKIFGPHDSDGLTMIKDLVQIQFVSGDHRGFEISRARIERDMGYPLTLVSAKDRMEYIEQYGFDNVIYMGDGYFDAPLIEAAWLGICPQNARVECRRVADLVTTSRSAEGAVLDACIFIKALFQIEQETPHLIEHLMKMANPQKGKI